MPRTLLGIAEGLLAQAGGEWPPDEREQHDGTLAQLREPSRATPWSGTAPPGRR